jgi:CHAD domain-containing protein
MKETLEHELKLGADPRFRLPELPGTTLPTRVFTSTYWDTPDYRLARAGVTLRRRIEERRGLWQLKLPRGFARLELELPGGPTGPPERIRELLVAHARGAQLAPVAKLRTRRAGIRVEDGNEPVADVTVDSVAVLAGGRVVHSFRELEAELLEGADRKALRLLGRELRKAGAHDGDGRPKLFQALDLEGPREAPVPGPGEPAAAHLTAAFEAQRRAILAHDPGTRLGTQPEELHQMRVATRRMRAFLRAARPLLDPSFAEPLRAELQWLGSALGPVRDLDVLLERLRDSAARLLPREQRALRRVFAALESERAQARAAMLEALGSERYLALLDQLEAAATAPLLAPSSDASLRKLAAGEFRRLRRAVSKLPADPSDEELHEIRIKGKRARYAAELAETAVGKPATRFLKAAKELQDVLGSHQDTVVAEERIRQAIAAHRGAVLAFAAGRLVEQERTARAEARAAFPKAWKRLEKAGREAWRA